MTLGDEILGMKIFDAVQLLPDYTSIALMTVVPCNPFILKFFILTAEYRLKERSNAVTLGT